MGKYQLVLESYRGSVERHYFAILELLHEFGFKTIKTEDTFNSSITSSFWGNIEQRRTLQQEKAAQFLRGVSEMVKALFQIIRELRIMDERAEYYKQAKKGPDKKSAEIALKSIWTDMVEGGGKNPGSVYGLATQVGFSTLPDLFFDVCPKDEKDLKKKMKEVEESGINKKVIEVLRRKLFQYMQWRDKTEKEIKQKRKFSLAYLRQHFNTIRLYLNWIKPYVRNAKKLKQQGKREEDLLQMADTAIADIELFAYPSDFKKNKKYIPTITVTFEFRTVPELAYRQEYQKGAIHIGRTTITFKGETLLIDKVKEKFRQDILDDIEILKDVNASMAALGDELVKYLEEAEEQDPEGKLGIKLKEGKKKPPKGMADVLGPFKDIGKGFKDLFGAFIPGQGKNKKSERRLITYDLPKDIELMIKNRKKYVNSKRGRKIAFKLSDDFKSDKEYKAYLKKVKKHNTIAEKKELKKGKSVTEGEGVMWKIYDTFKKTVGAIRW